MKVNDIGGVVSFASLMAAGLFLATGVSILASDADLTQATFGFVFIGLSCILLLLICLVGCWR